MRWTWVSQFDEGSLASETTRCLRQLGDLEQGRQQAERIISLRPSHRTRSRAFGQLALSPVQARRPSGATATSLSRRSLDLPPGSYPDRTSTGKRRRACEHDETPWHYVTVSPPALLGA
jgi:hypothetical protein